MQQSVGGRVDGALTEHGEWDGGEEGTEDVFQGQSGSATGEVSPAISMERKGYPEG